MQSTGTYKDEKVEFNFIFPENKKIRKYFAAFDISRLFVTCATFKEN